MEETKAIAKIIKDINSEQYGELEIEEVLKHNRTNHYRKRPLQARTLEDIASVGCGLIEYMRSYHAAPADLARSCGVEGKDIEAESVTQALLAKYIIPFLDHVESLLPEVEKIANETRKSSVLAAPATIVDSLKRFQIANRSLESTCFIMMRFGKTSSHSKIEKAIKQTLSKHGIKGMLARDREYNDELFPNILTYVYGCTFGIAVFERLETEEFNPNVALEVGYMLGLRKQVLLLKDSTLKALHTDLVGKLYREFDPQDPAQSIPGQIESWLTDKGLA